MICTGKRAGAYNVEVDEHGDEVLVLDEALFASPAGRLPRDYRAREVTIAAENLANHERGDLLVSRTTLHEAVQKVREELVPPWGELFLVRDPRPFSSVRKPKKEEVGDG